MAMRSKVGIIKTGYVSGPPKKTRQGNGNVNKYASTSLNNAKKKYRGQGK